MKRLAGIWLTSLTVFAGAASAIEIDRLPEAYQEVVRASSEADSASFPIAPRTGGQVPMQVIDGAVEQAVFRTDRPLPTLELLREIFTFLQGRGFAEVFRCYDQQCGGFAFLAEIEVVAPPEMFVDIGDFRFLTARRDRNRVPEFVGIVVSRSAHAGFVQITAASETLSSLNLSMAATGGGAAPDQTAGAAPSDGQSGATTPGSLTRQLLSSGYAVLGSIEFASNSLALSDGDSAELVELAEFLNARPQTTAILVGHTDTEGMLESNVELSRMRAESVLETLVARHGVDPDRLTAEGIGFLAPRATNETAAGRALNRRVEVILVDRK